MIFEESVKKEDYYEATHFRLFTELLELTEFFEIGTEPKYHFMNEGHLDLFLGEYLKGDN